MGGLLDRGIALCSLVPNDPVLDMRAFPWTQALRANWQAIRDEAHAAALGAPPLAELVPARGRAVPAEAWRGFFLYGHGHRVEEHLARCPVTARAIAAIPGLTHAFFSILAPGAHIPRRRGITKGLITCHLGLIVPRDGDPRMRVGDRVVRWAEGETLVFDDSYDHEAWNDTGEERVVLLLQFRRPLRQPGRWLVDRLLAAIRGSAPVGAARARVVRQF